MKKQTSTLPVYNGQTRYVTYYRGSTRAQGDPGLGLEA